MHIIAKDPRFITSANNIFDAPPPSNSEIAMIGRSNVGKSSFLNLILGENLAKSSSSPGKTRLINFFALKLICDGQTIPLTLIDLPGFGYARVDKAQKEMWRNHLEVFLKNRSSIKIFIHLRDCRHKKLTIDEEMLNFLHHFKHDDQHILTIYTKADKLKQNELHLMKDEILSSITKKNTIICDAARLRKILLEHIMC